MRTIKSFSHYFSIAAFVGAALTTGLATTIWNGPIITYTQPGTDPTNPANQDPLTSHVVLTRAATGGLFNAVSETGYIADFSPADTAWAVGELADYATLMYADWKAASDGKPLFNLPGRHLVCHLLTDDIFLSVMFTDWGDHGAGGFSYQRSTPAAPALSLTSTVVGNNLDITWASAGPLLQSQVNNPGVGLGTNWVDVAGSTTTNHVLVPLDRSKGSVFYRLSLQ